MNKSVCLSVTLSGHVIVDRFSLTLPETGCLCLFGPSGCGKTTLLRALGGLLPAQFEPENPWQGKKTAILFQEDRLFPWMTVKENIQCVQKKPARVLSLPDELGLDGLLKGTPMKSAGDDPGGWHWRGLYAMEATCCCWMNPPGGWTAPGSKRFCPFYSGKRRKSQCCSLRTINGKQRRWPTKFCGWKGHLCA